MKIKLKVITEHKKSTNSAMLLKNEKAKQNKNKNKKMATF